MASPPAKVQKTEPSSKAIMVVKVHGLNGSFWEIECNEACTVREAKVALEVVAAVPRAEQILLAGEEKLQENARLQEVLSSGATLTMLRRKQLWDSELDDGQTPEAILEYSNMGMGIVRFDEKYELTSRRVTALDSGVFESISSISLFKNWFSDKEALTVFCTIICSDLCGQHLECFTMCDCCLGKDEALSLLKALLSCPALKTLDMGLHGEVEEILEPLELLVTSLPKLHEVMVNGEDCKNLLSQAAAEELSRRDEEEADG